jgi:hypothetical protein
VAKRREKNSDKKKGDKKKEAHPFSVSTYSTESPPPPLVIFIIRTARIRR